MSYGISVSSSGGFMQIDGTYENLAVFASGTATANVGNVYSPVAFPANTPADYLIFAKPSIESGDSSVWFSEWTENSSYPSFIFGLSRESLSSIAVDWIIAIRTSAAPAANSSGYGLEVNKANGDQAFNSENGNFRCQQVSFEDLNSLQETSNSIFSVSSMSGVYALMSGKGFLGRLQFAAAPAVLATVIACSRWNYADNTIRTRVARQVIIANQGGFTSIGGGFRTNLIGTFG